MSLVDINWHCERDNAQQRLTVTDETRFTMRTYPMYQNIVDVYYFHWLYMSQGISDRESHQQRVQLGRQDQPKDCASKLEMGLPKCPIGVL